MFVSSLRACLFAGLIALAPGLARAATHALPADAPVVSVTIPDAWKILKEELTLQAESPGEDVYLSFMLVRMEEFTVAMKFWDDWLARMKITRDEASKSSVKFKFHGGDSITTTWKATDEDGPTGVVRTILKLSEENLLFVTGLGTEAAQKNHDKTIRAIQRSVTKLK